jgi:hypothetical protein
MVSSSCGEMYEKKPSSTDTFFCGLRFGWNGTPLMDPSDELGSIR